MNRHLLWIDLETTGLDPREHCIAEVAAIITDFNLNEKFMFSSPIFLNQEDIDDGSEWCAKQHGGSGLYEKCLDYSESTELVPAFGAIGEAVKRICGDQKPYLAGNSVHFDRSFLMFKAPRGFLDLVEYRQVDVSSIKVLCQQWMPKAVISGPKPHRALDDIRASINELASYRKVLFTGESNEA